MADGDLDVEDDPELQLEPDQPETDSTEPAPEPEPQPEPEGEPEPLAATEQAEPQQQPRQPSRAETRIRTLTEQIRERDARLAETNRRIDDLIARQQQPQPQRETAEQRAARFAIMTPQEQIAESLRESEARWEQRMQGFQLQTVETQDRTAFQAKAAVNPVYAKWAPKVEGKKAELAAKGQMVDRETILKYLIGEAALDRLNSKEGKREVQQAQTRVANARVKPTNSASDTQATRRQQVSLERRLENLQI